MEQFNTAISFKNDGPRERLSRLGAESLSDIELLAVLLGSGTKEQGVIQLARETLRVVDEHNLQLPLHELCKIKGIGVAKACILCAALEFVRRRIRPEGVRIKEARDVIPLLQHLADRKQEHFVAISLNGAYEVINTRIVSVGLANSAQVHPREVFSDAILDRACAVIVAHNHPSGRLIPSSEDERVTKMLKEAGEIIGIKVLDHIIFSRKGYYSFAEQKSGL